MYEKKITTEESFIEQDIDVRTEILEKQLQIQIH